MKLELVKEHIVVTLIIRRPDGAHELIKLKDGQNLLIGRDYENDIVLDGVGVSRFHAVISANMNGLTIEDLKSTNGIAINDYVLKSGKQALKDGDKVKIHDHTLIVKSHVAEGAVISDRAVYSSRALTVELQSHNIVILGIKTLARIPSGIEGLNFGSHWFTLLKTIGNSLEAQSTQVNKEVSAFFWDCDAAKDAEERCITMGLKSLALTKNKEFLNIWSKYSNEQFEVFAAGCKGIIVKSLQDTTGKTKLFNSLNFEGEPLNLLSAVLEAYKSFEQKLIVDQKIMNKSEKKFKCRLASEFKYDQLTPSINLYSVLGSLGT